MAYLKRKNNTSSENYRNLKKIGINVLIPILLLIIASLPRFFFATGSLSLDEADYTLASMKGFWANSFDTDFTRELRHYHPPVFIYLISFCTWLGGISEFFIRLPSIVFGVLNCLLLYFGSLIIFDKHRRLIGIISSFLLAVMPLHIDASKQAIWHCMSSFLSTLILIIFIHSLKKHKDIFLFIIFLILGVYFATFEYSFIVGITLIISTLMVKNVWTSKKEIITSSVILGLLSLSSLIILIFLWAGGVLRLHLFKNLIFFVKYTKHGHPVYFLGKTIYHLPWWSYIYWYIQAYPLFLILFISSLIYLTYLLFSKKLQRHLLPLPIFLAILLAAMFRQHIIGPIYSLHTTPIFCLLGGMLAAHLLTNHNLYQKLVSITFLIFLTMTSIFSVVRSRDNDNKFKDTAQFLESAASPTDAILSWYGSILNVYLPNHRIESYPFGNIDTSLLCKIKMHKFKFIVFHECYLERWPEDPGYYYVSKNFQLVKSYLSNNVKIVEIFEDQEYE